ncbi:MAG: hypothetical protein IPJ77_13995 [Planctomycetes bacterium]|nr:hypothetical protein [Planctomycetota bacterium]
MRTPSSILASSLRAACALLAAAPLAAQAPAATGAQGSAPSAAAPLAAKEYFYFRMWPDYYCRFDPVDDQIVAKVKFEHGLAHEMEYTHDQKQVLMVTGQKAWLEIIDLATMQVVDAHCFDEVGYVVRIDGLKEQPGGKRWFVRIDKVEKKPDQFVVADSEWLDYDLEERAVVKRMKELPKAIRSGSRVSPDGKTWHVFGKDFAVVDPVTLEETAKIELSKPPYAGAGPFSIRGEDFFDRANPDAYRFMYTMRDPVLKNRTLFGLIDLDLKESRIASYTEWGSMPRVGSWIYSRDHKVAVASRFSGFGGGGGGRGGQDEYRDPQTTLVTFDLTNGKKLRETVIDIRNGLHLSALSPDATKLYLTGRGDEIWIYGADHKYLRTLTMPGDIDAWSSFTVAH